MVPDSATQIRWGLGVAGALLLIVAAAALLPDPFFRQRVMATTFDDVEGVTPGSQIYFRGAQVGAVRSVDLDGPSRTFTVKLGIDKEWQPSSCAFASVAAANPLVAPRIELVALEANRGQCAGVRRAAGCEPVAVSAGSESIIGCRRSPNLIDTAALAIGNAAAVAGTANAMAQKLAAMLQGGTSGGASAVDMAQVARDATQTLAALNGLSTQLDRSFRPGKGDIAVTLANVRQATGRASEIDIASLNAILRETQTLVAQNQANIADMLSEGRASAREARMILEGASASLVATSVNLERASENLGSLSEKLSGDPTFAIRGQRYADPPAPEARK